MENSLFTQLAQFETKLMSVAGARLVSFDNHMAILGCQNEVYLFELWQQMELKNAFPYGCSVIEIPQKIPGSSFIKDIKLSEIHANCNVLEKQELALEPVYIAEYSVELPKSHVAHISWAPILQPNDAPLIVLLTTYGYCGLYRKSCVERIWKPLHIKLHNLYLNTVFPMQNSPSDIKTFPQFKEFNDTYWITAVAWDVAAAPERILYTANAKGCIVAFKLNSTNIEPIVEYCKCETAINRITYIKSFDRFLIICNQSGEVHVFVVERGDSPRITHSECLWNKADRMAVHQMQVTLSSEHNSYFVVFTKGAHVLGYRLSLDGLIIGNSTCYISGAVNITGLQTYSDNEYVITTITGRVRLLKLSCATGENQLDIVEESIAMNIDDSNMQILGLASTRNHNVWSFVIHRNRDYTHKWKYNANTIFIKVYSLNSIESLTLVSNLNVMSMDAYADYLTVICMNLLDSLDADKYNEFCPLTTIDFPKPFNDAFLQKLQIKLFIVKTIIRSYRVKFELVNQITTCEYDFLIGAVQIVHILCRLRYLQQLSKGNIALLTSFQKLAAATCQTKCQKLLDELMTKVNEDDNPLKEKIEQFAKLATEEFTNMCFMDIITQEKCLDCNTELEANKVACPNGHTTRRCSVSYVQISVFKNYFCPQCHRSAQRDISALQQLFAADEVVKCTFCRFSLVDETI